MTHPNLTPEQQEKFFLYQEEILRWNKTTNLIGRSTEKTFCTEHLANSLEIAPYLTKTIPIVDIGTGGGLPGIPIAIALPHREVFLTEVDKKKLAFLHFIIAKLKLSHVHVQEIRPSTVLDMPCDIVSRAFGSVSRIVTWTSQHAPRAETYYLLKGPQIQEELLEACISHASLHPLSKGCLVIFDNPFFPLR